VERAIGEFKERYQLTKGLTSFMLSFSSKPTKSIAASEK
ncbi:unnamed protein product, partial [marine sediment metagenome]